MRNLLVAVAAVGALAFAGAANAALLDFTDSSTPLSGTIDGVHYDVSATGGAITNSQAQDGNTCGTTDLACEVDGLGVNDDEVSDMIKTGESITIDFGQKVAITGIALLDLFQSYNGIEEAVITWDGGSFSIFGSEIVNSGASGLATWIGSIITTSITFTASNIFGDDGINDFAVAALRVEAVPLPAALPLFLAGLAGLGFARGRKRKAA
ncbi:MAG TPA: VPLPA-CTERM sorting domain-containing protein [Parvularculaceae bacterium]|nr:VPLPA-CTERM sorting domain-containing protein [Parvularculaceae bacterium]